MQVLEVRILGNTDFRDCESFPIKAGIHYVRVPFKTGPTVLHYGCPTCKKMDIKADICEAVETNYDPCFHLMLSYARESHRNFLRKAIMHVFVSVFQ